MVESGFAEYHHHPWAHFPSARTLIAWCIVLGIDSSPHSQNYVRVAATMYGDVGIDDSCREHSRISRSQWTRS